MVTHEITIIRSQNSSAFCENCGETTLHLSLAELMPILAIPEDEVLRLLKSGDIHHHIDDDGSLRLCGSSAAALKGG